MTKDSVQAIVDRSSCCIDGVTYVFHLRWVAVEKYCDPGLSRQLLRVEVVASGEAGSAPATLNLLVWISQPSELPTILADALQLHLVERALEAKGVAQRMPMVSELGWQRATGALDS